MVRSAHRGALIKHAKSATDFATNADIDAERAILEVITAAWPSEAFKQEEGGRSQEAGAHHDVGSPTHCAARSTLPPRRRSSP